MSLTKEQRDELEAYKFADSALAYGVLISAGIGIGLGVSTLATAPVFSTVGGGVGFGSALTFTHFISYEDLYNKHFPNKDNENSNDLKSNYAMNGDYKIRIPSPSFKIKEFVDQIFCNKAEAKLR